MALGIAAGLFFGLWGWVYQGYEEDVGTGEVQSWPLGVGGYAVAWALGVAVFRRVRPEATPARTAAAAVLMALVLVAAAFGALAAFG